MALNNNLGEAYASLGAIEHWTEWKWDEAKRNYEQAIALSPSYAEAHKWYGQLLDRMGYPDTGIREVKQALELDPLSPISNHNYGEMLYQAGRYDEASRQFRRVLELAPDYRYARVWMGLVYLQKGMYEKAIEDFQPWSGFMTAAYSALGMDQNANTVLEESKEKPLFAQLRAYVGVGWIDEAFEIIDQMVEQREVNLPGAIGVHDPYYSALHGDPRLDEVLKRMGLR